MKAFLLAAGLGTRLRPLTETIPKCLVPIQGRPLLDIWFELLRQHGIGEVLLNAHWQAEAVREYIAGRNHGLRVTVFEEQTLLGSAGTIAAHREWVAGDDHFWVLFADVLTNADLSELLRFHRAKDVAATLGVYRVPDPQRCGIVQLDDHGVVQRFVEKPSEPCGDLAFSGVMLATPEIFEAIPPARPVDLGSTVLPRLAGRMAAYPIPDYLLDIGTMDNYSLAQSTWPGLRQPAV